MLFNWHGNCWSSCMVYLSKYIMSTQTNKTTNQTNDKRRAHANGSSWEAPTTQIHAVILWDEAGSTRRTGSGNLIQVNITTESRG